MPSGTVEQRINHWQQYRRATDDNPNYVTQGRHLKDLRAEFGWIAAVSQTAQTHVLKDLDTAFQRSFKGKAVFSEAPAQPNRLKTVGSAGPRTAPRL